MTASKEKVEATQRPWRVEYDSVVADNVEDAGDIICDAPSYAEVSASHWPANAELIVRAVNNHESLLAACRKALDAIGVVDTARARREVLIVLSDAITKATAEQNPGHTP